MNCMRGIISPDMNCERHALSWSFALIPSNVRFAAAWPFDAVTTLWPV